MTSQARTLRSDASRATPSVRSGLDVVRARIRAAKVAPAEPGNLRLATWNIREFGKGSRMPESLRIIAEIVRAFDLVSIVELRDDLGDLARLMKLLGRHWGVVFSDYIRDPGGNRERLAFLYDARRVTFTGLASNAEGPRRRVGDRYQRVLEWWRPPFLASFRAARFDFILVAAHVRWGATARGRVEELDALLAWVRARSEEEHFGDRDVIAVGDFNVGGPGSASMGVVAKRGFVVAPGIGSEVGTSIARLAAGKRYDQILCLPRSAAVFTGRAGAVNFYCGDHRPLFPGRRMTKGRFAAQVSDHLPLWAEISVRAARVDGWRGLGREGRQFVGSYRGGDSLADVRGI